MQDTGYCLATLDLPWVIAFTRVVYSRIYFCKVEKVGALAVTWGDIKRKQTPTNIGERTSPSTFKAPLGMSSEIEELRRRLADAEQRVSRTNLPHIS